MVKYTFVLFLALLASPFVSHASQDLVFDAKRNKVELVGPYIRYNFLTPPFSYGQKKIVPEQVTLRIETSPEGEKTLMAAWPINMVTAGSLKLYNAKGRLIHRDNFTNEELLVTPDTHQHTLPYSLEGETQTLAEGVRFCVEQKDTTFQAKICSHRLRLVDEVFQIAQPSNRVKVRLNGRKVPLNAQIELPKADKKIDLKISFLSGFSIVFLGNVSPLSIDEISLNIREKTVGVTTDREEFRKAPLSWRGRLGSFLSEKNYYKDKLANQWEAPQAVEDSEMEFTPFESAPAIFLYGLSFDNLPKTEFGVQLDDDAPIATYRDEVVVRGFKAPEENVYGLSKGSLRVSNDKTRFLWTMKAPEKGQINEDHVVYSLKDGHKFYFSRQVFRGHQFSVSASGALGSSLELDILPGYLLQADYWPETLGNRHPLVFQRWGLGVSKLQTFQKITVKKTSNTGQVNQNESWGVDWTRIDLMGRFNRGVRPVQSSFGGLVRYNIPNFTREGGQSNLSPHLLGVGLFWHTGPQKIVDEFFNLAPFLRYPKWVEMNFVYYPFTLSDGFASTFSFSMDIRGRLFFSSSWFLDASASINAVEFSKENDVSALVATAQGTFGIGYQF